MDESATAADLVRQARAGKAPPSDTVDSRRRTLALAARAALLQAAELENALSDPDARVRHQACEIAGRRPDLDVELVDLLTDPEPLVAEAAAFALGERRVTDHELSALIAAAGNAAHALVREAAVAALGAVGDPRGLEAVLAALADVVTVRRRAVLALAPFSGPAVERALAVAAADRDWQVRNAARDIASAADGD